MHLRVARTGSVERPSRPSSRTATRLRGQRRHRFLESPTQRDKEVLYFKDFPPGDDREHRPPAKSRHKGIAPRSRASRPRPDQVDPRVPENEDLPNTTNPTTGKDSGRSERIVYVARSSARAARRTAPSNGSTGQYSSRRQESQDLIVPALSPRALPRRMPGTGGMTGSSGAVRDALRAPLEETAPRPRHGPVPTRATLKAERAGKLGEAVRCPR